ncbi:hypothetical protein AAHC03_0960 [Spirometra sp. Aus1]
MNISFCFSCPANIHIVIVPLATHLVSLRLSPRPSSAPIPPVNASTRSAASTACTLVHTSSTPLDPASSNRLSIAPLTSPTSSSTPADCTFCTLISSITSITAGSASGIKASRLLGFSSTTSSSSLTNFHLSPLSSSFTSNLLTNTQDVCAPICLLSAITASSLGKLDDIDRRLSDNFDSSSIALVLAFGTSSSKNF